MSLTATERLRRFYEQFVNTDRLLILINADPDAIASAMAVSRLLWRKVAITTIAHVNRIKRPDNLAMIRLLSVKLIHIGQIDPGDFNRVVMVDSQPSHNPGFEPFTPDVVIDHHPDSGVNAPFVDIRSKYGATASILTEYLRAARIKPSVKLATGLFLGIKADTSNFERQAQLEDMRAFQFLFRYANLHLAQKIEQSEMEFSFLKYFKRALEDMQRRSNRIFVHLGSVSNPDICVLLADFFMRVNSVRWAVISGINRGKLIVVLRNDGIRKNAGTLAAKEFGTIGSAGGHKSMARAEIELKTLKAMIDVKNHKSVIQWIIRRIEGKGGRQ